MPPCKGCGWQTSLVWLAILGLFQKRFDAGVTICAGNFPDSLDFACSIARMGARLLLSPCAWAVDADRDNLREPCGDFWLGAYSALT